MKEREMGGACIAQGNFGRLEGKTKTDGRVILEWIY
jgi:hypothetical protein